MASWTWNTRESFDWDDTDRGQVLGHFDWPETPSTFQVVMAQEDLWVYEALLRVIKKANEGATTQANAAIKKIEALEIGQDAAKMWNDPKERESLFHQGKGGLPGSPMAGPGGPPTQARCRWPAQRHRPVEWQRQAAG